MPPEYKQSTEISWEPVQTLKSARKLLPIWLKFESGRCHTRGNGIPNISEFDIVRGANRLLLKFCVLPTNVPRHSTLLVTLVSVQVYSIPCSTIGRS